MADYVQLPVPNTFGDQVASDEIGGLKYQRVKMIVGDDGVNDGDISSTNPLPVEIQGALGTADTKALGTNLVDGDIGIVSNTVIHGKTTAGGGSFVDVKVNPSGALAVDASGSTVSVTNFPATQPISAASLPLPTGAATETTLASLLSSAAALVTNTPINGNGVPYVTTAREKFRDAFLTFDTTNNWFPATTGSGMTVSVAGAANGARYLNIASGTTINSETIILSRVKFKAPCTIIVGASLSQRIANQDFFIEMVEVDANGNVITDTTQPSARFKDARNGASFQFNGTVATTQTANVRQDGLSEVTGTGTYTTTVATGTNPNFLPAGLFEITLRTRDIQFSSVAVDSNTTKVQPIVRTQRVPNPDATYVLRIRAVNGGTAPASTTDFRIHSVVIIDDTRISVDFGSISGALNQINALPVVIAQQPTVGAQLGSGVSRAGFIAGSGIWYDDSSTALAGAATFTGTSRDLTVTATATAFANAATYAKELRVSAESDVTGTLWLEVSRDNTNWRRIKSVATSAVSGGGFYAEIVHRPSWRYARVGYTNGAGAQARFSIGSFLMAI